MEIETVVGEVVVLDRRLGRQASLWAGTQLPHVQWHVGQLPKLFGTENGRNWCLPVERNRCKSLVRKGGGKSPRPPNLLIRVTTQS